MINCPLHSQTSVTANDGVWHHICVSWESSSGSWKFYKDGLLEDDGSLKAGHTIGSGGTFVLGQDQDSVGGGFNAAESFQGMLSNVNVWNRVLTATEITEMSKTCLVDEPTAGKVKKWLDFLREGEARLVVPSSCEPLGMGRSHFIACACTYVAKLSNLLPIFAYRCLKIVKQGFRSTFSK